MNAMKQHMHKLLNCLSIVHKSMALGDQPMPLLQSIDYAYQELIGHKAITLFSCNCHSGDIERLYTGGQLTGHPAGGTKNMRGTEWGIRVLEQKETFIVHTQADFDRCFPTQSADVAKNNCPSCLSYPVLYDGRCFGAINLLHEANYYSDEMIELGQYLAPLMLPALLSGAR